MCRKVHHLHHRMSHTVFYTAWHAITIIRTYTHSTWQHDTNGTVTDTLTSMLYFTMISSSWWSLSHVSSTGINNILESTYQRQHHPGFLGPKVCVANRQSRATDRAEGPWGKALFALCVKTINRTNNRQKNSPTCRQRTSSDTCRAPGAYSVNVWGQRASAHAHNRSNNNPRNPYMQAKNLQRHLKKIHGENCTVHKFYCIVFAKPLHRRGSTNTACTFAIF